MKLILLTTCLALAGCVTWADGTHTQAYVDRQRAEAAKVEAKRQEEARAEAERVAARRSTFEGTLDSARGHDISMALSYGGLRLRSAICPMEAGSMSGSGRASFRCQESGCCPWFAPFGSRPTAAIGSPTPPMKATVATNAPRSPAAVARNARLKPLTPRTARDTAQELAVSCGATGGGAIVPRWRFARD
jgi:hypothetical protein